VPAVLYLGAQEQADTCFQQEGGQAPPPVGGPAARGGFFFLPATTAPPNLLAGCQQMGSREEGEGDAALGSVRPPPQGTGGGSS